MSRAAPQRIDPVRAAEQGRAIEGAIAVSLLTRVGELLVDNAGEVQYRLQFGRVDGFCAVRGSVTAELLLECQCCLSPLPYRVEGEFALGLVASPELARSLPEALEPLVLDAEGMLSIVELIEDEVLLSLPYVPQHPVCVSRDLPPAVGPESGSAARKPFADLSSLVKLNH